MNIYVSVEVSPSEVLVIYTGVTNESQQKRKKNYFAKLILYLKKLQMRLQSTYFS